jgi:hypothetical protein
VNFSKRIHDYLAIVGTDPFALGRRGGSVGFDFGRSQRANQNQGGGAQDQGMLFQRLMVRLNLPAEQLKNESHQLATLCRQFRIAQTAKIR